MNKPKPKPGIARLKRFLRNLPDPQARAAFAVKCGTTINYLRKVLSKRHFEPDAPLCIAIERESGGEVKCEELRPDADWAFLRATNCPVAEAPAS